VVAPTKNRRGVECPLHGRALRFRMLGDRVFSCTGLPSTARSSGRGHHANRPDVVVSGINKGANLGTDIIFSGPRGPPAKPRSTERGDCGEPRREGRLFNGNRSPLRSENLETLSPCARGTCSSTSTRRRRVVPCARLTTVSRRSYRDTIVMLSGALTAANTVFMGVRDRDLGDGSSDWEASGTATSR
jgi:5'-nucleotidase